MVQHTGKTIPTFQKRVAPGDEETFPFDFSDHFGASANLTSVTWVHTPALTQLAAYTQGPIAYIHLSGFAQRTKHLITCTATADTAPNARKAVRSAYVECADL